MKIADGKVMRADVIRQLIEDAKSLLIEYCVSAHDNGVWLQVRDWLRSRLTTRTSRQTAMCYLTYLMDKIGQGDRK